ncbi:MAG: M36 family metallopeptidase [Parvularculaceae bacterium]
MKNRLLGAACSGLVATALVPAALAAGADNLSSQRASVARASASAPLSAASRSAPEAAVRALVAARGRDASTLRLDSAARSGRNGVTHLRFVQVIDGYRVAGRSLKASVNARGEVVFLADDLVAASAAARETPRIDARQALKAALTAHGYKLAADLQEVERLGALARFEQAAIFHAEPTVERVFFVDARNALRAGFEVETWSEKGNRLHLTLVDASGRVVSSELRTNTDSYNIFVEDPDKGSQTIVSGPGAGNAESPAGWLKGLQKTVSIRGNNVRAYLDAVPNNRPDVGGVRVTNGQFLAVANLVDQPSTVANRAVAVQNLFYLNNRIHDILYGSGFNEAAGNFQLDNFGNGGAERDAVKAEAQDGSGTDNANFATPPDGRAPRMQMFLWSAAEPDHEVVVNAPPEIAGVYDARRAAFGPLLTPTGLTGSVVLVNDGTGVGSDACEGGGPGLTGAIALIDRGTCTFVDKVLNAQAAGAVGVIVANNAPGPIISMSGSNPSITIPSVMVSQADGATFIANLDGLDATMRRDAVLPPAIDGDLDSDIVYHEYGHGLTWRMIGTMSGPQAGAIGEGASDALAFLVNGDDRIGEYAIGDAAGIRRDPYDGYPRTYGDAAGLFVHDDGEIYAAIIWRLLQIFIDDGKTADDLLDLFVDGMNFTPSRPLFEDMRDGILQSAIVAANGDECRVWSAFAEFGVGVGASGAAFPTTESFVLPPQCQPVP